MFVKITKFFLSLTFFHRRIDVSPSAFMRHSFLFDELKGSGESSSKVTENFEICHVLEKNAARVGQPEHR